MLPDRQKFHTIFGFDTTHKISAQAIDIIYWVIIGAAYCFAYHALSLILTSWNWFLVGLTSLGVVAFAPGNITLLFVEAAKPV